MYDPPGYLWAITIAGIIAIPAATCLVLYGGAVRAGLGRRRAALLAGGAAVVLGGWFTASAVIAGHGWYHARLGHGVPWLPVAVAGFLGLLLALRRIPVVARALAAPGMASRLELPHAFRVVEGTAFLLTMALGHLPALFALPAGLGDIAAGIAAPLVARRLAQGTGRRAALWFNAFGMTDLVVRPDPRRPHRIPAAQRHPVRCADQRAPARADPDSRRAAAARPAHHLRVRAAQSPPSTAASHRPAHCRRHAAYCRGGKPGIPRPVKYSTQRRRQCSSRSMRSRRRPPGRAPASAPPSCSPASSWPPSPARRAIRPHDCTPGVGPVNGKETQ